jgi:hypothetical protein
MTRLRWFYFIKASKSKNSAKIAARLQELDLKDIPTILKVEEFLSKYR